LSIYKESQMNSINQGLQNGGVVQLVDLELGNLNSVVTSLLRSGVKSEILQNGAMVTSRVLILPGVGNFTAGSKALDRHDLRSRISDHVLAGGSLIGICLGMQLLGTFSEEGAGIGLSLLPFDTKKISNDGSAGGPVMGWKTPALLDEAWLGLSGRERYYFMHDYGVIDTNSDIIKMTHSAGKGTAASSVASGRIIGFQFHPERSLVFGQEVLASAVAELSH
tara:strand:- start:3444 stop:4109 length:666 start_codon:yes stop_codon:yes gene_type:complete